MPETPVTNIPQQNPILSQFATDYATKELLPTVATGGFGNRAYEIPEYELERHPITDFVLGVGSSVVDLAEGVADIIPMVAQGAGSDSDLWDNWISVVDGWAESTKGRFSDAANQPVSEGLNWNNFMAGLGQGVGFIGQMYLTGGAAGAVGAGARGAKTAQFLTGTLNMTPGVYKEAREAGLDPQSASLFSISLSSLISMTEGAALDWMGKSMSKPITQKFARESAKEALASQAGKEFTKEAFDKTMALTVKGFANRMKAAGAKALEPTLIESTQEFSQQYIEEGAKQLYDEMFAQDKEVGEGKFGANIGSAETFADAMFGALIGGVIGGGMSRIDTLKKGYQGETLFGFVNNSVKKGRPDNIEWLKQQAYQASVQGKSEIPAKETVEYIDKLARFSEQTKGLNIQSSAANYQLFQMMDLEQKIKTQLNTTAVSPEELHPLVAKAYKANEKMAQMIGDQMNSEMEQIIETKAPITSDRTNFEKRVNQYGFLLQGVIKGKISEPVLQARLESMKIKPQTKEQVQEQQENIVESQDQPKGDRTFVYKGFDVPENLVKDAPKLDTEFQQAKLSPDTNVKFIEEKSKEYGVEPAALSAVIDNVPEVNQLYAEDKLIVAPQKVEETEIEEPKTEEVEAKVDEGKPGELETESGEITSEQQQIADDIVSNKENIKGLAGGFILDAAQNAKTPEQLTELIDTIHSQAIDNRQSMESMLGKETVDKIFKLKEKQNVSIQKSEPKSLDVRKQTADGQKVGKGNAQEKAAKEGEEKIEQKETVEEPVKQPVKQPELQPAEESQETVTEERVETEKQEGPEDNLLIQKRSELAKKIREEYRGLGEEDASFIEGKIIAGEYDNLILTGDIRSKDQRLNKTQNAQSIRTNPEFFNKVLEHFKSIYPNIPVKVVRRLTNRYGVPTLARVSADGIEVQEDAMQTSVIHEYAHVYLDLLGEENILVQEGLKEIKKTNFFTEAKLLYPELSEQEQAIEALAEALAEKSVDKLKARLDGNMFQRFMEWAKAFWKRVKRMFTGVKPSETLDALAQSFVYQNQQINVDAKYLDQKIKYQVDKRTLDLISKLQEFTSNKIDPYEGLSQYYKRESQGELKAWEPRLFEGYVIENPTKENIKKFYEESLPQFHEFIENTTNGIRISPSEEISNLLSKETSEFITNVFKQDGTTWQGNTVANFAHEQALRSESPAELYNRIKESAEDEVPNVVGISLTSALESIPEERRNKILSDLMSLKDLQSIPVSIEYLDTKPTIDEVREEREEKETSPDSIRKMFNKSPGAAKSIIKELKSLIPSLRINEEEVVNEDGNLIENDKTEQLINLVSWANDPSASINPNDLPQLFDMFSDHYLMEVGLKKYGEARILNAGRRYLAGEEVSRDFRTWIDKFLHETRMVLGNESVRDVLNGAQNKEDEFVFEEFHSQPTTKPEPKYTTDYHSVDGTFDTTGYHDQETDLTILTNEQAVKSMYAEMVGKGIVNPITGWVNTDGMADYFRKMKSELFRIDTVDVAGKQQYANWAALDHRMLNDAEEVIRNSAVSVRVAKEIMGSISPQFKEGLEELSPDQWWALETMTKIQQRLHYVKGLKKGYFARENTQVAEEKILEDAKKALEYGTKKRKANYDKIKFKPLRDAVKWMEKNLVRWQMNSYMDIKLLTGSSRNVIMKMFYDSLNQAESNRIEIIREFDKKLQMEKLPEDYNQWSAFNTKGISIDKVVGKSFQFEVDKLLEGKRIETVKLSNAELLDIYMMLRQDTGSTNPYEAMRDKGFYIEDEIKGRDITDGDLVKFTNESQLKEIESYVESNPAMMEIVAKIDEAMDYMYEEVGNTYRQETGFTLPKINNYFPVYAKDDVIDITKRKASINEFRAARLRLGDNRPIRIGDINKVLVSHKVSASLYASHALPVTNNRKFLSELKNLVRPGTPEAQYVDSLDGTLNRIEDPKNLFSSVGEKEMDKLINKVSSNFAVSVLAMNLPIIFKQPVGYFIMKGFIDSKYLKKAGFGFGPVVGGVTPAQFMKSLKYTGVKGGETALPVEWKTNTDAQEYKEITKHSPRLAYRMEGAITRELGEAMSNAEAGQDRILMPWKDKKTGEPVYISKARLLEGIRVMDNNILMNTWKAVKLEAAEKYPNLKEGSPEYWDHIKSRTEFIINQTQPTYEMINRPELGASPNPVARFITMFTSASSKVGMNMVDRVVSFANNPSKENRAKLLRFAADNLVMSAAALAAIDGVKAMVYGADDDEIAEKVTTEAIVNNLGYFYLMNIVANKVAAQVQDRPWAADTKHPVEMMIDDVAGFLANIADGDVEKAIWNGLAATAKVKGLPLQGVIIPKNFVEMMNE